jgi:hypothetical protein
VVVPHPRHCDAVNGQGATHEFLAAFGPPSVCSPFVRARLLGLRFLIVREVGDSLD